MVWLTIGLAGCLPAQPHDPVDVATRGAQLIEQSGRSLLGVTQISARAHVEAAADGTARVTAVIVVANVGDAAQRSATEAALVATTAAVFPQVSAARRAIVVQAPAPTVRGTAWQKLGAGLVGFAMVAFLVAWVIGRRGGRQLST